MNGGGGGNGVLAALDIMGGPEEGHTARSETDAYDEAEVIVVILDFGRGEKVRQEVQEA